MPFLFLFQCDHWLPFPLSGAFTVSPVGNSFCWRSISYFYRFWPKYIRSSYPASSCSDSGTISTAFRCRGWQTCHVQDKCYKCDWLSGSFLTLIAAHYPSSMLIRNPMRSSIAITTVSDWVDRWHGDIRWLLRISRPLLTGPKGIECIISSIFIPPLFSWVDWSKNRTLSHRQNCAESANPAKKQINSPPRHQGGQHRAHLL